MTRLACLSRNWFSLFKPGKKAVPAAAAVEACKKRRLLIFRLFLPLIIMVSSWGDLRFLIQETQL